MPCCVLFWACRSSETGRRRIIQPLKCRQGWCKWDGTKKGKFVAAFDKCPDNDRLRSCLWPEVLEGTMVLRIFDTQLYNDLRDSCAEIP